MIDKTWLVLGLSAIALSITLVTNIVFMAYTWGKMRQILMDLKEIVRELGIITHSHEKRLVRLETIQEGERHV